MEKNEIYNKDDLFVLKPSIVNTYYAFAYPNERKHYILYRLYIEFKTLGDIDIAKQSIAKEYIGVPSGKTYKGFIDENKCEDGNLHVNVVGNDVMSLARYFWEEELHNKMRNKEIGTLKYIKEHYLYKQKKSKAFKKYTDLLKSFYTGDEILEILKKFKESVSEDEKRKTLDRQKYYRRQMPKF